MMLSLKNANSVVATRTSSISTFIFLFLDMIKVSHSASCCIEVWSFIPIWVYTMWNQLHRIVRRGASCFLKMKQAWDEPLSCFSKSSTTGFRCWGGRDDQKVTEFLEHLFWVRPAPALDWQSPRSGHFWWGTDITVQCCVVGHSEVSALDFLHKLD